jgi:hypothetical protein
MMPAARQRVGMVELAIEHMVRLTRSQVIADLPREVTFTKQIA